MRKFSKDKMNEYIAAKQFSHEDVAYMIRRLGEPCSMASVRNWMSGASVPSSKWMGLLATALDVKVDDFYTEAN